MLIVIDKSTHEEHLFQPLQTIKKQYKIGVTFLTAYNGIFNVTNENKKIYIANSITDEDDFIQLNVPTGAYDVEKSENEVRRIIVLEGQFREVDYPFERKQKLQL